MRNSNTFERALGRSLVAAAIMTFDLSNKTVTFNLLMPTSYT